MRRAPCLRELLARPAAAAEHPRLRRREHLQTDTRIHLRDVAGVQADRHPPSQLGLAQQLIDPAARRPAPTPRPSALPAAPARRGCPVVRRHDIPARGSAARTTARETPGRVSQPGLRRAVQGRCEQRVLLDRDLGGRVQYRAQRIFPRVLHAGVRPACLARADRLECTANGSVVPAGTSTARPLCETSIGCTPMPSAAAARAAASPATGSRRRRRWRRSRSSRPAARRRRRLLPRRIAASLRPLAVTSWPSPALRPSSKVGTTHARYCVSGLQNARHNSRETDRSGSAGQLAGRSSLVCSDVTWPCAHAQLSARSGSSSPAWPGR